LAWHYRKADKGLGELRAREIINNLKYAAAGIGLQIMEGNKVIEIKSANINKGFAAKEWLKKFDSDFVLAIGDDYTDEDTFRAMPEGAITIKVGAGSSAATYSLQDPKEVRILLSKMVSNLSNAEENRNETVLTKS